MLWILVLTRLLHANQASFENVLLGNGCAFGVATKATHRTFTSRFQAGAVPSHDFPSGALGGRSHSLHFNGLFEHTI